MLVSMLPVEFMMKFRVNKKRGGRSKEGGVIRTVKT